jgi:hypothetical protein
MAQALSVRPSMVMKPEEHRRFQRVSVSLLGRYMLPSRLEFACQTIDMSPGGVAMMAPVRGQVGDHVIAYVDHIGRVEGDIARLFDGGFAMSIIATPRKRDKLADQLTWLANRYALNLPEDRRHERIAPENASTHIRLPDGRQYRCKILDMSLSGARILLDVKPALGTPVMIGRLRGRVARHSDGGIAVEFSVIQTPDSLEAAL